METDYGMLIPKESYLEIPSHDAYNFGTGDFTITLLFQTARPGTLISRKSSEGGSSECAGWLLTLKPDGVIKMATDNGFGFYEVNSEPTPALDGTWHAVAAIRRNGAISIYFDGAAIAVTPRFSLPTPLDISNRRRIVIGDCDQEQEEYKQFTGVLEDISLWNRALDPAEIQSTMFNNINPLDPALVGLWELNQDFTDSSQTRNDADPIGAVRWLAVFHCVWAESVNKYAYCAIDLSAEADPVDAASIAGGGMITAPSNPAYNFGTGDFTVTALFQTKAPGTLVSRKSTEGGSAACAGWLVVLNPDGVIKLATDNGFGYYEVTSSATLALNGLWHGIAAVRRGGVFSIYLDGVSLPVTPHYSLPSPLNVSNARRIVIGHCDQEQEPYRQFTGCIQDVTLWQRALSEAEIQDARFNMITPDASGLAGFWELDNSFADSSHVHNQASPSGAVGFAEVHNQAGRRQTLKIDPGTPYLYGALINKDVNDISFPNGAVVKVYQPDGSQLDQETNTDDRYVHVDGESVHVFIVKNPQPGEWKFAIRTTTALPVLFSVQTTPNQDVSTTINDTLEQLYGAPPATRAALSWSWRSVAKWAGITLAAAGAVAMTVVAIVGAPVTLPILGGAALAVGVTSTLLVNIGLEGDIAKQRYQVADQIGVDPSPIGGGNNGVASLIVDGRNYFPLFRDLLLAVQAGHYDPAGITPPAKPTFENLIKGISDAGNKAYVLMWDTQPIYHMMEHSDFLKYYLRKWLTGRDARRNSRTAAALKGLPQVEVAMEKYSSGFLPINSQHQKLAVFSVNNVKCALVGGFNIITPPYWDDLDHPMYDHSNFHTWHDTAVLLQGPVVEMVEQEFNRRWANTRIDTEIANSGTYAKVACWQINHDSCFDQADVCGCGKPTQFPYQNPLLPDGPQYPIDVLITESQFSQPVTKIKDKLVEKIKAATQYVYFENFAFHDADLVRALSDKLKSAGANFRLIINLPPIPPTGMITRIRRDSSI
ncbi:concanavalin A-like lectin/glucanase superfamily protein [Hydrogenispora ethanolica]|uniref:Concanavalin A-like lectin/glucanase superfamily protein n=1 Tax=Hydrogenispora ethanolica TaxID=1082276 RepID=A0A4R1RC32_HYDET|nr:LamG-like jellyroll fold domain-containing protein [Hydrogenispora ethanolica]TCL63363.1 concanavalin A-like lectin/glucanase superfamily protein [Hydrogenispora ethanolica]